MQPWLRIRGLIIRNTILLLVLLQVFFVVVTNTQIVSTAAQSPPVSRFTYSPSVPIVFETVEFDASLSYDPDGVITSYFWDFGDGNTGIREDNDWYNHAYEATGTYQVILKVTDNDGLSAISESAITVKEGGVNGEDLTSPEAIMETSVKTPKIGETVTFNAERSNDNVGIEIYEWDFGDGTTGNGITVTHTYTEVGTYTIHLTVIDAAENLDEASAQITVKETNAEETAAPFHLWVLVPAIGAIIGIIAGGVYFRRRKSKKETSKPTEPIITAKPTEIHPPAKKTEEIQKPPEATPSQEVKPLPKLSAKCSDTIALLNSFVEDPSRTNDRKAWKGFREFITIAETIEDEYDELIEIRNKIAILRRKRNEYRSAGLDELADKVEGDIQSNYVDSVRIIKEIREKLPKLGG
jgi:PKD repeat protein